MMTFKPESLESGELDALASSWLEGHATDEQASRLGKLVEASPTARDRLLGLADLHAHLATDAGLWADLIEPSREAPSRRTPAGWASMAGAAGIAGVICGLLGASVVWAMSASKPMATVEHLSTLVDGGFESSSGRVSRGFPSLFGAWSGDDAEIVEADAGQSAAGRRMLRFVQAQRDPGRQMDRAASCDVYQLVDLRALKGAVAGEDSSLELSAQFRDARTDASEERVKFICRLFVFSGTPETLGAEWPFTQKEALAAGSGTFDSDGGEPRIWHTLSTKVLLPPQADFAVVHLVVHQPATLAEADAKFGEQFVDNVRISLRTQPTLPLRVAP
jgi:hypothetical protein